MAKLNPDGQQETDDLAERLTQFLPTISITTDPVFICGVMRRAGLGQWEHLDIYAGLALPMPGVGLDDQEALKAMAMQAAEVGYGITSTETYTRYKLIKDAQNPPREKP